MTDLKRIELILPYSHRTALEKRTSLIGYQTMIIDTEGKMENIRRPIKNAITILGILCNNWDTNHVEIKNVLNIISQTVPEFDERKQKCNTKKVSYQQNVLIF